MKVAMLVVNCWIFISDKQLYVEKVSILERLSAISQSVFNCNDWLDTGKQGVSIVEKQYSLSGKFSVVMTGLIQENKGDRSFS